MFNKVNRFRLVQGQYENYEIYDKETNRKIVTVSKELGEEVSNQILTLIDVTFPSDPLKEALKEYKEYVAKEERKYERIERMIQTIASQYDVNSIIELTHNENYDFTLIITIDEENEEIINKIEAEISFLGPSLNKTNSSLKYIV